MSSASDFFDRLPEETRFRMELWSLTLCQQIERVAERLHRGKALITDSRQREHVRDCHGCNMLFPEVSRAYERFDAESFETLRVLFTALRTSLDVGAKRAEAIVSLTLEDYLDAGPETTAEDKYQLALSSFESDVFQGREALAWRAVVLAQRVGAQMADYAATHTAIVNPTPWIGWRKIANGDTITQFVRDLGKE